MSFCSVTFITLFMSFCTVTFITLSMSLVFVWHQHRDQSECTEAWDSHKLQVPGLSYNWWGSQAWDTLQDSTDSSSIDKVETSLEWQEYFSQFQDTTDALPCHIHLPVCSWIMDPHSRAAKKNTSHGNEMLPQDTTHLIQRQCYQRGSPFQDAPTGLTSRGEDGMICVKDINQPSLPTPFYSVLVSDSVFMAFSTVFHSINSPDNSPLFHSVLLVLFLHYWSFQIYPAVGSCGRRN